MKWTAEEDKALRSLIETCGHTNWKSIASQLGSDKTALQCRTRWKFVLRPGITKGHWKKEEDQLLLELVEKYSQENTKNQWALVASHMSTGRTAKQCRHRWFNALCPDVRRDAWTPEEKRILIEAQSSLGNKWSQIAKLLPGRTPNSVKNQWNCYAQKKRKAKHDDDIITFVPSPKSTPSLSRTLSTSSSTSSPSYSPSSPLSAASSPSSSPARSPSLSPSSPPLSPALPSLLPPLSLPYSLPRLASIKLEASPPPAFVLSDFPPIEPITFSTTHHVLPSPGPVSFLPRQQDWCPEIASSTPCSDESLSRMMSSLSPISLAPKLEHGLSPIGGDKEWFDIPISCHGILSPIEPIPSDSLSLSLVSPHTEVPWETTF